MKQIVIALVLLAALASSSNSQAASHNNSAGSGKMPRRAIIFRNAGNIGKTGANAPKSIRATPRSAGAASGSPGDQAASNPLIDRKKKETSQ